jgi:hypothetical protein
LPGWKKWRGYIKPWLAGEATRKGQSPRLGTPNAGKKGSQVKHQHEAQAKTLETPQGHEPTHSTLFANGVRLHPILQLQQTIGNRAVQHLLANRGTPLQARLTVGPAHDPCEQEADRVSEQVMAAPAHSGASSAPPRIQCFTAQPTGQTEAAPASVDQALASPGRPLEPALQQDMERRFGHELSAARVHSGAAAEQSAQDVNARAYTVGHDIVFGAGQFAPGTHQGQRLIAHELTHVVQQSDMRILHRTPDAEAKGRSESAADSPYPEEENVVAYAVGAQKLGKFAEGMVLFRTKDWKAVAMPQSAFYVGPLLSDMGHFYYIYRFRGLDEKTGTYTLTRGAYAPGRDDKDLQAALAKVQGKTTVQVKTSGLSPVSLGDSTTKDAGAPSDAKGAGSTHLEPSVRQGSDKPSQAADILPEFADKTVDQCREIVGDIYGGLNKEANSGILDHKLDVLTGMHTILDKSDPAVSSDVIFFVSLITNAAAGALGVGLPTIAANAIIWGAAGAANGVVATFSNENLIDAVEFCQNYMLSLRMNKDKMVKQVRAAITGDLSQVRAAASAFRRMVEDKDQISHIKLLQEREVVDLWTNTILVEKNRKHGKKVGDSGDPGKVGDEHLWYATEGRILLGSGQLEAKGPPYENPFRWVKSPDAATMPGVPDRARQKYLNRKIGEVPVVRTMRVATSANYFSFAVAMSADGTETTEPQPLGQNPQDTRDAMHWILSSFLLDRALNPSTDDFEHLIEPNWKLGITKCWDQVRNKTFADLGIKSIEGKSMP